METFWNIPAAWERLYLEELTKEYERLKEQHNALLKTWQAMQTLIAKKQARFQREYERFWCE